MKNILIPDKYNITIPKMKGLPFTYGNMKCKLYDGTPNVYAYLGKIKSLELFNALDGGALVAKINDETKLRALATSNKEEKSPAKKTAPKKPSVKNQITEEIQNRIKDSVDFINTCEYQIHDLNEKLNKTKKELEQFTKQKDRIESHIDKILLMPDVKNVSLIGDYLVVETKRLYPLLPKIDSDGYIDNNKKAKFDLGAYAIFIDIKNLSGGQIKVYNTVYRYDEFYDGFHIEYGDPCWGNIAGSIVMLHKEMNLLPLIALIIKYLYTYTSDKEYAPYIELENANDFKEPCRRTVKELYENINNEY